MGGCGWVDVRGSVHTWLTACVDHDPVLILYFCFCPLLYRPRPGVVRGTTSIHIFFHGATTYYQHATSKLMWSHHVVQVLSLVPVAFARALDPQIVPDKVPNILRLLWWSAHSFSNCPKRAAKPRTGRALAWTRVGVRVRVRVRVRAGLGRRVLVI